MGAVLPEGSGVHMGVHAWVQSYLKGLVCMPETLLVEVRDTDCISQTILLTGRQPSQEGTVGKEVEARCWEVYLVQSKLGNLKAV